MRWIFRWVWMPVLALVISAPATSPGGPRPFGRNHDCVCAELQGYLDYLQRGPSHLVNSPVPERYSKRMLARRCKTTVSPSAYDRMIMAIRAYVYYCSQGAEKECLVSRRAMVYICPHIDLGLTVPPPPATRAECYNECKARCPRARDPYGDWGDLAIDPACLQRCSDTCKEFHPR